MTSSSPAAPILRRDPRRHSNARLALVGALERGSRTLGGRAWYRRRHLRPGRFRVREEILEVRDLPRPLEGLTCAHLTDLHAGPFLGAGDLADVVAAANALEPDLVFLTGDLITHRWEEALTVLEDLASLRARHAVLAVFGNHDYRARREDRIAAAYAARGIRFLRNASWRLEREGAVLAVVGVEDLEEGREVDLSGARSGTSDADVELALCHHPAGATGLAGPRCAAVFSGHTHGGQIDLPLLRRLGPAHPGARVRLGPTTLLVNRGLGTIGLPLRVGAPAELLVARLRRRPA